MLLVGFIIRIYHDARSSESQTLCPLHLSRIRSSGPFRSRNSEILNLCTIVGLRGVRPVRAFMYTENKTGSRMRRVEGHTGIF
jgi:hypothetical protein